MNIGITKGSKTKSYRVHSSNSNRAPVCGGGNSARAAQWQETIEDPNCKRCAAILQRKNKKASNDTSK